MDPFPNDLEALVHSMNTRQDPQPSVDNLPPPPTWEELRACQFSWWYPYIKALGRQSRGKSFTIPSIVLKDLPPDFFEYLRSDGIRLPPGVTATCVNDSTNNGNKNENDSWSDDDDESEPEESFDLGDLTQRIQDALERLQGVVLPKLNWSCPKDAAWINSGSLQCTTPGDVYLLLKASDFCSFDCNVLVEHEQSALELVLRKWCHLYPSQEYRVFVHNQSVIAISQRQTTQFYPHVVEQAARTQQLILDFWNDLLWLPEQHGSDNNNKDDNHPVPPPFLVVDDSDEGPSKTVVMDVYIDKNERVWLLDFNVWGPTTDSLLFDWSELMELSVAGASDSTDVSTTVEMRVVHTERQVRADPLSSYRAPVDVLQVQQQAGGFQEFMRQCVKPTELDPEDPERNQANEILDETDGSVC